MAADEAIRFLAGYIFALDLFHDPMVLIFSAPYRGDATGPWFYVSGIASILLSVLVLGHFTEKPKSWLKEQLRSAWRRASSWSVMGLIDRHLRRVARPA